MIKYCVILSKKNAITIFIRYFENDTLLGITIYRQTICSPLHPMHLSLRRKPPHSGDSHQKTIFNCHRFEGIYFYPYCSGSLMGLCKRGQCWCIGCHSLADAHSLIVIKPTAPDKCTATSAGTLLWIYRRLIGWPYISTRSAGPNISQYIGSTRQACNTSLQCIVEFITNEYHTAKTIGLHFGCNVCFISTIRYSKAPHSEIYNTYQILLKLHGATTETYRQYMSNISALCLKIYLL